MVDPIYPLAGDMYAPGYSLGLISKELRQTAREQLSRLAAGLQKRRLSVRTLLGVGAAYDVIVDVAKKLKVDLIVMSTHGRTGLSHFLIGSVAERVVRSATCPVLTVRGGKLRRGAARRGQTARRKTDRLAARKARKHRSA